MSRVLLLNATFEPLRVIDVKRAVCLTLAEKADTLETQPGRLRSETREFVIPAVIKLRNFVKIPHKAHFPLNRRTLNVRDNHECQVAGCDRIGSTVDHLHPRSRGGKHEWPNVVLMCSKHNFAKADRTIEEMEWTLKRTPRIPAGTAWLMIALGIEADPKWRPYLGDQVAA